MSRLLPSNLSHARRKLHKRHKLFSSSYPASFQKWEGKPIEVLDAGVQTQTEDNLNGTTKGEKRCPVPVVMVDQDPLQEMEPDEYGAELGKEARVWKVYVKETDQWDAELVDGWNRSLDVILVFAALFSAVSTAFLIESSKKLQEDPTEVSAAALRTISQFLLSGANSSSVDPPPSDHNVTSGFTPTKHAVVVNTLWYLSLSLSIATSLLAMLAKDWCHSFSANRTGHPWDQALRRQRKWEMIEKWKMQELITVLPSLIHISLLLFAIGLGIYVWDTNVTAAIPIICVSGAAFSFYVWSSIMASVMKLFPYTTIISRTLQSDFMHRQYAAIQKPWKWCIVQVFTGIRLVVRYTPGCLVLILLALVSMISLPVLILDIFRWLSPRDFVPDAWIPGRFTAHDDSFWLQLISALPEFIDRMAGDLVRSIDMSFIHAIQYIEFASPSAANDQDKVTSLALKWLIQNCETPSSVTIALQAIAGASSRIPSAPLKECQATLEILRRLVSGGPANSEGLETKIYIRALTFLGLHADQQEENERAIETSQNNQKKETHGDIEVALWDLKSEHERQVVNLINSTIFRPTKENITALTLGNSATSLCLRLIKGERQPACKAFDSIVDLLFEHVQSGNQKLDPAALHSLGHAALMLNPGTAIPFPFHPTEQLLEQCTSLLFKGVPNNYTLSHFELANTSLKLETVVVICILLQGYSAVETTPASNHPQTGANTRMKVTTDLLMNKRLASLSYQATIFRVGFLEVLFKTEQYGVEWDKGHTDRTEVSKNFLASDLLLSSAARESLIPPIWSSDDSAGVLEFLDALDQLYELLEGISPNHPIVRRVATPTYCMLICVASSPRIQSEAQALCQRLLSFSAFPKLDEYLVLALKPALSNLWPRELRQWNQQDPVAIAAPHRFQTFAQWRSAEDPFKARLRHFAATQTWLLLCLVGDASTSQQNDLKRIIGEHMYWDVYFGRLTVHEAKQVLEEEVIRSYKKGHHMGLYSARVVECILEARGTTLDDELARRIQRELENVPDCIRKLSSFLDSAEVTRLKSQLTTDQPGPTPAPTIPQTMPTESDPGAPNSSESSHPPQGTDPRSPSTSSFVQAVYTPLPPSTGSSLLSLRSESGSIHENRNVSHVIDVTPGSPSVSPTEDA